eukprot:TRINITY_DN3737_c0_g5_i1.p1 TRINITY_DN3737_c0_g5~~TRINITY_DN3737_c0_g5_i1.p1  ORF type:complete len:645 (-),score=111.08 TRINITY_DN3737_c0_g5_i1:207-2141(-)
MLELRDEHNRPITPDEYLEKQLHSAPTAGTDQSRSQGAQEVRQSLLKFFSHRNCATLVQPVVDEAKLQQLESLPYASMRGEFRAGVEALRTQLVATCHANPKTVGGQPLGCYSFVALARHLVASLNDNKALSMKGAWETVQHSACGALADELRADAVNALKQFASGEKLAGGAQLPMGSEALHHVLRDKRHALKAQWLERAVGDEKVRKEYWQELKESVTLEETSIVQINSRLADQQLKEVLGRWEAWLDDDEGPLATGEAISQDFCTSMERAPGGPLSRVGIGAIESAARRMLALRSSVSAHADHSEEAQRKARAWGEQATQQAGAARSEVEARHAELLEHRDALLRAQSAHESISLEIESRKAEISDATSDLNAARTDADEARRRCGELMAELKAQGENELALRKELEQARVDAEKAEAEKVASEKAVEAAAGTAETERQRLRDALEQAKVALSESARQLREEHDVHRNRHDQVREEHSKLVEDVRRQHDLERSTLQGEHAQTKDEHARMLAEARSTLDAERKENATALESSKTRLLGVERQTGVLEGQVQMLSAEASSLRERIAELQETIREADSQAKQHSREGDRLRKELEERRAEAKATHAEAEEQSKLRVDEFQRSLEELRLMHEDTSGKPKCGCSLQ